MKTFIIDATNQITVRTAEVWAGDGTVKFQVEQELAAIAATWPGSRLVEVWNNLKGVTPVVKFKDRTTAVRRIWKAIQEIEPAGQSNRKTTTPHAAKQPVEVNQLSTAERRAGETKTDQVLGALRSPNGATLKQLMTLTGWLSHSVRGFLSAHVKKRMGLRVKSFRRDGERAYRIRS